MTSNDLRRHVIAGDLNEQVWPARIIEICLNDKNNIAITTNTGKVALFEVLCKEPQFL